ncbi:MAG: GGDEF domain-containing protein [Pseudomonadota bacterium]
MKDTAQNPPPVAQLLDVLCPWYIVVDASGFIHHAGPAVEKLNDDQPLTGIALLDFLELRRPKSLHGIEGLLAHSGRKLHFVTRAAPHTELKGVIAPLPDGAAPGLEDGAVLSLGFGISVITAVSDYALTGKDFAVTDLTVEMLYLVEAKTAVMKELHHLNTRLETAKVEAEERALTDTLTGLGNRRALRLAMSQLSAKETGFAMLHIDLDHFKAVNDTFGHAAGDAVLLGVSDRLRSATRVEDTVIRQGGDEFTVVLPGVTEGGIVSKLAERLVREIEKPVIFGDQELHVSASIGISIADDATVADVDEIMEQADTALYVVKEQGRHGYRIYKPEMGRMDGGETAA